MQRPEVMSAYLGQPKAAPPASAPGPEPQHA